MSFLNRIFFVVIATLLLTSCNKEVVSVKGKISGIEDSKVELVLKGINGKEKVLAADLPLNNVEFKVRVEQQKPPFKLTVKINEEKEVDCWVFRYGDFDFEIDEKGTLKVNNSLENSEFDRISKNYTKMYFAKVDVKEQWVRENEVKESLSAEDEEKLFQFRKDIKKAYKLRKKSVLSTFRQNPQNRIAMALLVDEFEHLTSWQKKECLKTAQKYYSDCGINWQLKN